MKQREILQVIRNTLPTLQEQFGVVRVGVFGSVARNASTDLSDIDVVIESPPDLFAMVHVKSILEKALHTQVDLVRYRKQMNPFLKQRIEQDVIYV